MPNNSIDLGTFYIVSTPIGNLDDISIRAIRTLGDVTVILAEDTRRAAKLLSEFKIKNKILSCYEHNEENRLSQVKEILNNGDDIALISDAGTPTISDPGYKIISNLKKLNYKVSPIPGPSAAIAALSVSGLPTNQFYFAGFLPRKKNKRLTELKRLSKYKDTIIIYESPRRIRMTLGEIQKSFGSRIISLTRELTKTHEEIITGTADTLLEKLSNDVKGEITIVLQGDPQADKLDKEETIEEINQTNIAYQSPGSLASKIATRSQLKRSEIYKIIVELKNN